MKDTKITQNKIAARYNNTFQWAMGVDKEALYNIMEGNTNVIQIFKDGELVFSTGVSNTDRAAIVEALKVRK
tara:strand:- start:183 stop:398 length:216 start_codon:yes stop_codon:yes gene_type:complete